MATHNITKATNQLIRKSPQETANVLYGSLLFIPPCDINAPKSLANIPTTIDTAKTVESNMLKKTFSLLSRYNLANFLRHFRNEKTLQNAKHYDNANSFS